MIMIQASALPGLSCNCPDMGQNCGVIEISMNLQFKNVKEVLTAE